MANNNSITYWNSVKNTYSDSLPNPDVVTGAIFNDMNRGLMELKWRNSIQRTWKNSEIFTAYGSTVPSGYILMHECVDITFNDMASTSESRRHIVRFHLLKGNDEQIVTYRSYYDAVSASAVINVDFGSDKFPITVQTNSETGGANNKLKIEFKATANNAEEFSYWIETNAPCTTIFDAKNTARNSSSNGSWNNLSYILANNLGTRKGCFSDVYVNNAIGYQLQFYKLGNTTWKFTEGSSSASIIGTTHGSRLDVGMIYTGDLDAEDITATSLNVTDLIVTGSTTITNITNDNIYVSNIYAKTTGGSFNIRDTVSIMDGAVIFGEVSHIGNYTMSGLLTANSGLDITGISTFRDTAKIMAGSSLWTDRIQAYSLFEPITMAGSVDVTGTLMYDRLRANTLTTWASSQTPTSLSNGRYDLSVGAITIDLRNCANTAGDIYIFTGRWSRGNTSDPKLLFKKYYVGATTQDTTLSVHMGGGVMLIGSGVTGVFWQISADVA